MPDDELSAASSKYPELTIGHWELDASTNDLYWSDEVYSIHGLEPEGGIDLDTAINAYHPDDRERAFGHIQRALDQNENFLLDLRIVRPGGEMRTVRSTGAVRTDTSGRLLSIFGMCQDITNDKYVEEKLRVSEANLNRAQRLAHLGSWTLDRVTGEATWTDEQYRIFGYEPGEIKPSLDFVIESIHPDDKSRFLDTLDEVINSSINSYEHEYRIIRPNGAERYLHSAVEIERDRDSKISFMRGFYQDITDRKIAESESQRNQDQLATAAELIRLGYWEWDEIRDRAIYYSEDLIEILDVDATVFIEGIKEGEHIHPDDLDRYKFVSTFSDGREDRFDLEYRSIRRDGGVVYCREIGKAVRDKTGAIVRSFGIIQDISDSKLAEQVLEGALLKAEEGSRSKSEFLAHMSHELRTPLNAITGFSQLMTHKTFGELGHPKYIEYAGDVLGAGQHLISLINDILDLSKIEAGEVTLNCTNFSIHHAIDDCVNVIGAQGLSDPNRITTEITEEITHLYADNRMFRQVLLNLLSNAVKFTPVSERITITAKYDANGCMLIKVIDAGVGISSEDMPKVLEPFGQARRDTKVSHQGTGLGLPLSQKFMELHGGTLELESEPGVGTTVSVRFPPQSSLIK
jgi:PAS domain S-box-containing protein